MPPINARAFPSPADDIATAYETRAADAVVVACREWDDSLGQLEQTLAELQLAGCNVVGIAYERAGRAARARR